MGSLPFSYSPEVWPLLIAALAALTLSIYVWPRRHVPAGTPFFAGLLLNASVFLCQLLSVLAVSLSGKLLFRQMWSILLLWSGVAVFWRALDYAGLASRVGRRAWLLVTLPALVLSILAATARAHDLAWREVWYDGDLHTQLGVAGLLAAPYVYGLAIAGMALTLRVCIRSQGLLRTQAGTVTLATAIATAGLTLETARHSALTDVTFSALISVAGLLMWAVALFKLRVLDLAPVARHTLVEQMSDGMVVLDDRQRVVDINPAARRLIMARASTTIGRNARNVLGAWPELLGMVEAGQPSRADVVVASPDHGGHERVFSVDLSRFGDSGSRGQGYLLTWHDVTEIKRTQAELAHQRSAVAVLKERERMGREMHDGVAQVLGFIKLQAQAVSDAVARGHSEEARAGLARMASVTQEAHEEVRAFLLGVHVAPSGSHDLAAMISDLARRYEAGYGIRISIAWPCGVDEPQLDAEVQVQLLRVLQESLANVRKHAGVASASVTFRCVDGFLEACVHDGGNGFVSNEIPIGSNGHYGLQFMRERAEAVGGTLEILSEVGHGTNVNVRVPLAAGAGATASLMEAPYAIAAG